MSTSISASRVLNKIAASLVANERFTNTEEALWALALSAVRSKVNYYRQRIRKLERKHKTDFHSFAAQLKGCATPAQEDDC